MTENQTDNVDWGELRLILLGVCYTALGMTLWALIFTILKITGVWI